jgi:hypothetical protein
MSYLDDIVEPEDGIVYESSNNTLIEACEHARGR